MNDSRRISKSSTVVIPRLPELPRVVPVEFPPGFDGAFVPETWREERRRQEAMVPAPLTPLQRAVAEAASVAPRTKEPSEYALSAWEWTPMMKAVAVLIAIGSAILIWAGNHALAGGERQVDAWNRIAASGE